ncbi:Hypothetical Protein FCC1311_017052 [Hondaea fermentalgiana]|uniref:Uncharacterized protein n=1 Tax=Hondaea fermentalgiana TaxID=2315210 RepID=A0A2R5G371_9STRA|nr:Hypothetical Protein FCC1311_017052 [Hondaea fermentalgiana]|eukprot:GBG25486.1 Hypothetical Protein FCC1311_017052 [Hondaea fermentalgiana]
MAGMASMASEASDLASAAREGNHAIRLDDADADADADIREDDEDAGNDADDEARLDTGNNNGTDPRHRRRRSLCATTQPGRRNRRTRALQRHQSAPSAMGQRVAAAAEDADMDVVKQLLGLGADITKVAPLGTSTAAAAASTITANAGNVSGECVESMDRKSSTSSMISKNSKTEDDDLDEERAPVYTLDPEVEKLLEESFRSLQNVATAMVDSGPSDATADSRETRSSRVRERPPAGLSSKADAPLRKRRHKHRRSASILFKSEESKNREAQLCATLARGGNIFSTPDEDLFASPAFVVDNVDDLGLGDTTTTTTKSSLGHVSRRTSDHWREAGEASQRRRRIKVQRRIESERITAGNANPSPSLASPTLLDDNFIAALVAASNEELSQLSSGDDEFHQWSSGDEGARLATIQESDDDEDDYEMSME